MTSKWTSVLDMGVYILVFYLTFWVVVPFPWSILAFLTLLFYPFLSNIWQRKQGAQVGLDPSAFWPCLKWVLGVAIPAGILLSFWGEGSLDTIVKSYILKIGPFKLRYGASLVFIGIYLVLGFIQAYIFLGFFFNRLETCMGGVVSTSIVCVALFALAHAPNPWLMAAGAVGGALFVPIFAKYRNFIPIAIAHGLLGLLAYKVLLPHIPTFAIGRGYFVSF